METPSKLVALLEQDYEIAVSGGTQDNQATILAGLNWKTSYWVLCALKWLDQGAPIDQIAGRENKTHKNPNRPQKITTKPPLTNVIYKLAASLCPLDNTRL